MNAKVGSFALLLVAIAACGGGHQSTAVPPLGNQAGSYGSGLAGGKRGPRAIQDYVSAVMADSPLLYYRLNESSGTTAVDSSGNGYNGTYGASVTHGGPALVLGDTSPVFPGGTASAATVVTSPTNAALATGSGSGAFSVELWIAVPSSVSGTQTIWQQSFQTGALPVPAYIALNGGANPYFTVQINANGTALAAYPRPVLGKPNHVVLTWDTHTMTAYVNGVSSSGGTGSAPVANFSSPYAGFTIGGPVDAHTGVQGSVGQFAMYRTALPAGRVTAHYNAGAAPVPTPPPYVAAVMSDAPLLYYRLNETSGRVAADSSGNGYNGTYGASVTHGGPALVAGDTSAVFPGGTASAASVITSPTNAQLAKGSGQSPFSLEFWLDVPASISGTQTIWQQSFQSGALPVPAYVALNGGANPYFTVQINANGTALAAYPQPVLGAPNHVVLTWDTHTMTAYVNGVPSSGGTGSAPLANFSNPYAGFTVGGPVDAHTGFQGSLGEFAMYPTALTSARVNAHYGAGGGSPGTIVWQTGAGSLGQWRPESSADGQCAAYEPVVSGQNASFALVRDTNSTHVAGASACYRNSMHPIDPNTGGDFYLALGSRYTFTFQTVVTLNGNYVYDHGGPTGFENDLPGFVWQTHGENGDPCDALLLDNTVRGYDAGDTQYGNPAGGGLPVWAFYSCDPGNSDFTAAYDSADTLHDGQVDNWQIDITAQIVGQSGGYITVHRNGTVVYSAPSSVCAAGQPSCWWNFGPYLFNWSTSTMPPTENSAGITVQMNGMTLSKH